MKFLLKDMAINQEYKTEIQVFESTKMNDEEFQKIIEENKVLPEFLNEFTTNFLGRILNYSNLVV